MGCLLLLPHIRIGNANAASGLTWGFPSMTHFLGYIHTLFRKVVDEFGVSLDGCAVVSHEQHIQAYSSGRDFQFALTRNPLTREGKTASFSEEGRMHLTVSLLIECSGETTNGEYGRKVLCDYLKMLCQSHKPAGDSIVSMRDPQLSHAPEDEKQLRKIVWRLVPGHALYDRSEWLAEHHQQHPDISSLDAWLDFAAIKYQAESPTEDNSAKWVYQSGSIPGFLIPLMCGYQRISPVYAPGEVENAHDTVAPFALAETVCGIDEWCGSHRTTDLQALMWRYRTTDTGYYCSATPAIDDFIFNKCDDLEQGHNCGKGSRGNRNGVGTGI